MIYLAIPASIGLGLLIAVLYVGTRVVSARQRAAAAPAPAPIATPVKQTAAVIPSTSPLPSPPSQTPVEAKVEKKAKLEPPPSPSQAPVHERNESLTLITPRSGETYLQLAALSPQTVVKYISELRESHLEPSVAPGPTNSALVRVLVGPFPNQELLTQAKENLNALKLEWIVRAY